MNDGNHQNRQIDLRLWQHCAVFLLACALIVSRRPDAVFHAQFWAEDGRYFFADAYNVGWWAAIFRAYGGYFHALPRLGAAFALLVPFSLAPLVLNLIAIAAQALPVNLMLSARSSLWGSLRYRILLAAIYLALPNCNELFANITNSQCLLALSAFLLLVASTPRGPVGRLFDMSFLLLFGLSGPYCIFLLPIGFFLAWRRPDRWRWARFGALAASCLVQACGLLILSPNSRPHYDLGASPALFARILAGPVYLGTLLGGSGIGLYRDAGRFTFLVCVAVVGTAMIFCCFVTAALEMRLLLLFSSMVLAASLIAPTTRPHPGASIWQQLAGWGSIHYFFFPTLAFAWSLLWCFQSRAVVLKAVSTVLLCLMCFGIVRDWRQPAFQDLHFAEYARRFEAAPVGTVVTIPINPEGWEMRLVKRPPE
jgi:hypothetical protein